MTICKNEGLIIKSPCWNKILQNGHHTFDMKLRLHFWCFDDFELTFIAITLTLASLRRMPRGLFWTSVQSVALEKEQWQTWGL